MTQETMKRHLLTVLFVCCSVASTSAAQNLTENLQKSADVLVLHKIRVGADQVGNLAYLNLHSGPVLTAWPGSAIDNLWRKT